MTVDLSVLFSKKKVVCHVIVGTFFHPLYYYRFMLSPPELQAKLFAWKQQ